MTFQYCFDGSIKKVNNLSVSSPRTWGCFLLPQGERRGSLVFPTHVGVFPLIYTCHKMAEGLPHARGGVSRTLRVTDRLWESSPRTWGCFFYLRHPTGRHPVFPTHVGVFLSVPAGHLPGDGLPHARGGVSISLGASGAAATSSPRTWGCFSGDWPQRAVGVVFPTHVGVFLRAPEKASPFPRLPHARGGVSQDQNQSQYKSQSSPRTWGCFCSTKGFHFGNLVFPTHVGVFLVVLDGVRGWWSLPHARGGVSAVRY